MMRYRLLGSSGLRVSELCLGTMTFGEEWQFGASLEVSRAIFDAFCAAGGNFIDTANTYTYGTSEKLVGEFIASERDYFVVSTKYSLSTRANNPNGGGNHRKSLMRAIDDSLRRLNTDRIDVYWLHAWDALTPADEVMRGLDDLVRAGKVLYVGISNTPAWCVAQANTLADLRGWTKFVGYQTEYSLIERTAERDIIPMAHALGLGLLAWAPLAGGVLSGKYVLSGDEVRIGDTKRGDWLNGERLNRRSLQIAASLAQIAESIDRPPSQVALNWLRQRTGGVIPIVAARTQLQMEQNLGCLNFEIDAPRLKQLDEASEIDLGFPHHFLAQTPLQSALFGTQQSLFDVPAPPSLRPHLSLAHIST
ncbi:aldo/keto reductase [Trinickia sp.]|uniref:aldo/keto reductase n=1 Tax=Trinickia sp. TaxID=2571163 RepID=UPI003F7FBAD3